MNKNNPINAVYLITLACVSLVTFVNNVYQALVFAVTVVAVFLFAVCIVSMIEKIADRNVKFLAYSLIAAALITILKFVFQYVNISLIVTMSEYIDIAIVPCLLIGIVPIYFEDSFSVKQYFSSALLMSFGFIVMIALQGAISEIAGYGAILNKSLGFKGLEFFIMPYGRIIIVACLSILFNIVRRAYLKRVRRFEMLVEKYKIQVREIQSSHERKKQSEGGKE